MYNDYYLQQIDSKLEDLETIITNQTTQITKLEDIKTKQDATILNIQIILVALIIGYIAVYIRKLLP